MTEPEKRPETEPGSPSPVGEGLTFAAFVALLVPAGLVCLLWFSWAFSALPLNLLPGLLGLVAAALLWVVAEAPNTGRWHAALRWLTRAVTALALAALAAALGWNAYQKSLTVPTSPELDTDLYRPFSESSRIARLEGEASLRFSIEDDLPVLDGKDSLFPLCAAMVNATYPQEAFSNLGSSTSTYLGPMGYYKYLSWEEVDIRFDTAPKYEFEDVYYSEDSDVPMQFERILLGGQGLVFFTHAANPVEGLTRDQLRGIYSGTITNWAEVGGADTPILPYQHEDYNDAQAALRRFMGAVPLAQAPIETRRYLSGDGGEYLADYRNSPGAIGFTFSAYADQLREKYHIKLLAVDGVYPDGVAIGQGRYPLTDSFYMVLRQEERTEEMDRFIAWALGEEGQELVARAGYAPVGKSGETDSRGDSARAE